MFFLLRMAFWLGLVLVLLPIGAAQRSPSGGEVSATEAISAASATVGDLRGFCERQPEACTVGSQVATAIDEVLKPHGVAVLIEAEHTCMSVRGVAKPGASTVTTRFLGTFRDSTEDQVRFVTLARGSADKR